MSTFGERFKLLREEKKLSQKELAKIFNEKYNHKYTNRSISAYENNRHQPSTLKDFAEYFEVSTDYLLGISDIRNPNIKKMYVTKNNEPTYIYIDEMIKKIRKDNPELNEYGLSLIEKSICELADRPKQEALALYGIIVKDKKDKLI